MTVPTAGWPEGDYLIRLDAVDAAPGAVHGARFVPLTVRSTSGAGKVLLVNAVTTWQAYNMYGGYDLYTGPPKQSYAERARIVSFDRPYDSTGRRPFQTSSSPGPAFAERHGLPLGYATDVDLHANPGLFKGAAGGHLPRPRRVLSTQMRPGP